MRDFHRWGPEVIEVDLAGGIGFVCSLLQRNISRFGRNFHRWGPEVIEVNLAGGTGFVGSLLPRCVFAFVRDCYPSGSAVIEVDLAGGIGFVCSRLYAWDAAVFDTVCSAVALDWLAELASFSQT